MRGRSKDVIVDSVADVVPDLVTDLVVVLSSRFGHSLSGRFSPR